MMTFMTALLSSEELLRYQRQTSLEEIGIAGQSLLKNASILCIGAGGLGTPVLQYLAAAGVGTIGIIDQDLVELSNLQRQVIFTTQDIGQSKSELAKNQILAINPTITVNAYNSKFNNENANPLIEQYDIIIDCSDNFTTRYLVNDICIKLSRPLISASILKFKGQCSVFLPGGPCLRCLFPHPPSLDQIPNCSEAGVLGVLPGLLGTIQASEALKLILDIGENLSGKLLTIDLLSMQFKTFHFHKNPDCFCADSTISIKEKSKPVLIPSISAQELKSLKQQNTLFNLLDVREASEYAHHNLGGIHIPLKQLPDKLVNLDKDLLTIIHCKSGPRSQQAAALLLAEGFTQVKFLKGGINAWLEEINPS